MKKAIKLSMITTGTIPLLLYVITIPLRNLLYDIVCDEISTSFAIRQIATFIFNYESSLLPFCGIFAGYFILFYVYCKNILKKKIPYGAIIRDSLIIATINTIFSYISAICNGLDILPIKILIWILTVIISLFTLWRIDCHLFGKTKIVNSAKATVKKLGYYVILQAITAVMMLVVYFILYVMLLADKSAAFDLYLNKIYHLIALLSAGITYSLLAIGGLYPKFVEKVLIKRKNDIK